MAVEIDTKRLQLLQNIDSVLGSSYNLSRVIRKIYKEIKKVLDTSNFYIAIYHPQENTITFEIYTVDGKEVPGGSRKLSKGLTEYVIETKKPLLLNRDIKKFCRRHKILPKGRDAKSWLGVPMIYKNNVEGVITIQDYKKYNVYTKADVSFLMSIASRAALVIANTRLIQEEIERAKQLSLMNQIAHRLTRSLNIDDICESVTKSIIQKFKNFNVSIFLVEDDELVLRKLSRGFRDEVPRNLKLKFGQGIVGNAALYGKTIVADDVSKNKYYLSFGQTTTHSEVAIPLKISRKTIGILNIECNELNGFNPNAIKILELIADRLSVALHNAKLYQDATNHAKELAVSFTIAQSLISALELDDVLNKILEVILEKFGVANIAILLIDPQKKELYIRASHGYSQHIKKKIRLKIGKEGICGYVAATGKPYYAPDVSKVPFYVSGKRSIKSEIAIPLMIKGQIIGVLDIESERLNAFSSREIRIFSVFASQAAIAIENARLFDETKSLSLTDGLTKIANRRHFDLMLENEFRKARGYSRPVSLAMIDLDDFKKFNDRYGHPAGDKLLIHIAQLLKKSIRDTDFVARYGGEEFSIIFPETDQSPALRVAERVRKAVKNNPLQIKELGSKGITISIGVATYPVNAFSPHELIQNADKALYRAKKLGKDRVETV
ncbi:hypothetical protein BXT86_00865 [candidate division WOR-3 bacterium 4484_100]|uniref:GGDEF domain-containing protein n=1 Tax=candidate division WOR-3 bacterium 4484_100 TaxID=1936077 RepID=A0A1V4QI14_UNCW3|nr:MAG: hypothetical protein BXT86_00865 [candidate division WOR-3 bacterium 4484_100]